MLYCLHVELLPLRPGESTIENGFAWPITSHINDVLRLHYSPFCMLLLLSPGQRCQRGPRL